MNKSLLSILGLTILLLNIQLSVEIDCLYQCTPGDCADESSCRSCRGTTGQASSRVLGQNCKCPNGYTDKINQSGDDIEDECVIDCAHQCDECDAGSKGNTNICTKCKDEKYLLPHCYYPKEHNYSVLALGGNKEDTKYYECAMKCRNCETTADNCVSVDNQNKCQGLNRDIDTCNCKPGYYDNEGRLKDCEACPSTCAQCINYNHCSDCNNLETHRELNEYSGACECQRGYRQFEEDGPCKKCFMLSDVCVEKCPQNTVQNQKAQVCETLEYEMISNATLILILGIFIGLIQVGLCCLVYVCLQKKHDVMEKELFEEQMKIKQQRDHIYKNMENYNASSDDHSKSGTGSPFKSRSNMKSNMDESELSQSNLQSSQVNLFNRDSRAIDNSQVGESNQPQDLDDVADRSQVSSQQGKRRRRRQG